MVKTQFITPQVKSGANAFCGLFEFQGLSAREPAPIYDLQVDPFYSASPHGTVPKWRDGLEKMKLNEPGR